MSELYKVLLVDDEEDVRQSIAGKLDWAGLGFEVVGQASNGEEALEAAELLVPDVIMTDIKMPFMDGLELARRAKQALPGVRIAIFSGFDEFEYAREAIARQVDDYILKPIDAGELTAVFRRLRQTLDDEIARRRDEETLRQYYEQSLPLMRQQLLGELLDGQAVPNLADFGLELTAGAYCVAVVRADAPEGGDAQLLSVSLRQLVNDTLEGAVRFYLVPTSGALAVLLLLEAGDGAKRVTGLLGQLFPIAKKLLGMRLSIGVGGVYRRAEEIGASYDEARQALEYQILVEAGQCICIGDIEPGATTADAPAPGLVEDILRQIKVGGEDELRAAVDALVAELKRDGMNIQQYQITLMELGTELMKLIRSYRLDPAEAHLDELLMDGPLLHFSSLDEMGRWLLDYCDNLRRLARRERKDSARMLVAQAKDIIDGQYADSELSLDVVCSRLNVSPAYFSTLFKKETGQGFVGYLTATRMEKALDLIATTDDKTYQIAEKVGYADPNYFSYVFKKQFGTSPSKYKAEERSDGSPTAG